MSKHACSEGLRRCIRKVPWKIRPRSGGGVAPARSEGTLPAPQVLSIEDVRKVRSQYIRDGEGWMLQDPGHILGRWARFFGALLNAKSDKLRLDIIEGLPQWPIRALGV